MLNDADKKKFLEALADRGNFSYASACVGYNRRYIFQLKADIPEFKAECDHAMEEYCDKLVAEVDRRAFNGVDKPVFYMGWKCGHIREYSDSLLMFRVKKLNPEYRDSVKISGDKENPLELKGTIAIVDFDPNDPESIARAHEAVFGAPEALTVIKGGSRA